MLSVSSPSYRMYRYPREFVCGSRTLSGSWPDASGLARMRSRPSLGKVLRIVWLRAPGLLDVVMWWKMLSIEASGAMVVVVRVKPYRRANPTSY